MASYALCLTIKFYNYMYILMVPYILYIVFVEIQPDSTNIKNDPRINGNHNLFLSSLYLGRKSLNFRPKKKLNVILFRQYIMWPNIVNRYSQSRPSIIMVYYGFVCDV